MGRAQQKIKAPWTGAPRLRRGQPPPQPGQYVGTVQRITSKGVPVQLDFYHNLKDGINDGWTLELIEAHTAEGPAGYLKIAFIPEAEMERWYPSAFEWAVRLGGHHRGVLGPLLDKPEAKWTRSKLLKALTATDPWHHSERQLPPEEQRVSRSTAELRELWRARRQEIAREHERGYREFRGHHLEQPVVDYIYVYDERETRPYQGGARVERGQALGRDCQRQGIGTVLYETGALWMHERGLRLHASGLQSDEAIGAWSALRGRGLVRPVKGATRTRQVFDVEPLLAEHPELFPVLAVPESGSSSPASR